MPLVTVHYVGSSARSQHVVRLTEPLRALVDEVRRKGGADFVAGIYRDDWVLMNGPHTTLEDCERSLQEHGVSDGSTLRAVRSVFASSARVRDDANGSSRRPAVVRLTEPIVRRLDAPQRIDEPPASELTPMDTADRRGAAGAARVRGGQKAGGSTAGTVEETARDPRVRQSDHRPQPVRADRPSGSRGAGFLLAASFLTALQLLGIVLLMAAAGRLSAVARSLSDSQPSQVPPVGQRSAEDDAGLLRASWSQTEDGEVLLECEWDGRGSRSDIREAWLLAMPEDGRPVLLELGDARHGILEGSLRVERTGAVEGSRLLLRVFGGPDSELLGEALVLVPVSAVTAPDPTRGGRPVDDAFDGEAPDDDALDDGASAGDGEAWTDDVPVYGDEAVATDDGPAGPRTRGW